MRLLVALMSGLAAALAVGAVAGVLPAPRGPRRPDVDRRAVWLAQAGADLTPTQFRLASAALGLVAFVVVVVLTATPVVAVAPGVGAALLPAALLGRTRARRLRAVEEAWPDGVRDLLASIRAGRSLHHAVLDLAANGPAPLRDAFARYPVLAQMSGVVPALEVVREQLADPTSDRVIEVLVLAHDKGGALLTAILHDLAEATASDLRVGEQIATDQLEQRINARAVFVLPWVVLVVLTLRPGAYRDFYAGPGGLVVVLVGALLSAIGMWVIARLGRAEEEPRVLGAAAGAGEATA